VIAKRLWGEDRVTFEHPDGSLRSVPGSGTRSFLGSGTKRLLSVATSLCCNLPLDGMRAVTPKRLSPCSGSERF
jgi:hypothetical protein